MAIIEGGATSNLAEVDAKKQVLVVPGVGAIGAAGGHYTVTGQQAAVVAATLAASTMLMSMRFNPASSRKAYVDRMRVVIAVSTVGASAVIPGTLGLVRFTAQTPTGGSARTVCRMDENAGTASDMFDVRDSNAALTGTAPTWGNVVSCIIVPIFITTGMMALEWVVEPPRPIVLAPGDGLALRTLVVMPATQTWVYSYTTHWEEK